MRRKITLALALGVVGLVAVPAAIAQNAATPSLQEQLEAQYQVTNMNANPFVPGTVLVLQKEGVYGVPPSSSESPTAAYKNGVLYPPRADALVHFGKDVRPFAKGEKVYVRRIEVNLTEDWVKLFIIECGDCTGAIPAGSYKSVVNFDFSPGYLQSVSVPDVEDTIAQVFDIYTPLAAPPPPAPVAAAPTPAAPATSGQALTNNDIIKLVQAKLPDSLIIDNIHSSACAFDTSPDGLIKLKQAGVSDAVLQAMAFAGNKEAQVPRSAIMSARMAYQTGGYEECVVEFNALLRQYPDSAEVYLNRGIAYFRMGQVDKAMSDYAQAIKLDPNNYMAYIERSSAYNRLGDAQNALRDLNRAVEVAPDSVTAHRSRAIALDKQHDYVRELADLDAIIRLSPDDPMASRMREMVLRRLGSNAPIPEEESRALGSSQAAPPPTAPDKPLAAGMPAKSPDEPSAKQDSEPRDGVYATGGNVSPPVALYKPDPDYTAEAKSAKVRGHVILQIVVDDKGNVTDVKEVSPKLGDGLDEKAMETVRTWKFKPAMRQGAPVPVRVEVEVSFWTN